MNKEKTFMPETNNERVNFIQPEASPQEVDFEVEKKETGEEAAEEKEMPMEAIPTPDETEKIKKRRPLFPQKKEKTLRNAPTARDQVTLQVEKILEEDLKEQFEKMSPVAQQEFKLKGEEVAGSIRDMLRSAHVKAKKIFRLIVDWLSLLPGVNRFFLEQEAKIKTDKIIRIKQNQDGN